MLENNPEWDAIVKESMKELPPILGNPYLFPLEELKEKIKELRDSQTTGTKMAEGNDSTSGISQHGLLRKWLC